MLCLTILSGEFSPSRTPLLGFSLEPDDAIISRRFCRSCTGCQFTDASLQTSVFCLLVFIWSRTSVPRQRHTSGLRKSSTAATLFHRQIVCRSMHTQHIPRQELRCRRATCLEQSSGPLARRGHYVRRFQAWTKRFVLMLLAGRSETLVNCAI